MAGAAFSRRVLAWTILILGAGVIAILRPAPPFTLVLIALVGTLAWWWSAPRSWRVPLATVSALLALAVAFPARVDTGYGRFFADQTYHHQVLRALNHMAAQGADVSEVLVATEGLHAGDARGWYDAWTALGDRNAARAERLVDRRSRGEALLRAHTYYLRAEFFLAGDDPLRPASFDRNRRAFYAGLDALGVPYERIAVPYGEQHLNAVYYPPIQPARGPLLVFCGGYDSTMEELYFFLAAAASARGYGVLTFEGPGQGSILREQHLTFVPDWEKPTSAVLDAFLASHPRPPTIVNIGLSMGGYLAARAAAFEERFDGVVSYDVFYDVGAAARRDLPSLARALDRAGFRRFVDGLAQIRGRLDLGFGWKLQNGLWTLGQTHAVGVVDALAPYTLDGVATRIKQDVLILAGTEDQFIPLEQVKMYEQALGHARSVTTKVYDRLSGGAEHSQLGAASLWQADLFDWLAAKFETKRERR